MYREGAWLAHKQGKFIGFVDFSNQHNTTLWVRKSWGLAKECNVSNYNLYKMGDNLLPDELYELIDMALAMGDNDWFISLSSRMDGAKERH